MKNYQKLFIISSLSLSALSCFSSTEKEKTSRIPEIEKSDNTSLNRQTDYSRPGEKATSEDKERVKNSSESIPIAAGNDKVSQRIYGDYGAVFKAQGVNRPPKVMFSDQSECENWQSTLTTERENIGGITIELQTAAMQALLKARESGIQITPRGSDAAKRGYNDTVRLWTSRVNAALQHWTKSGRLSLGDAARIRALSPTVQVGEVLNLESQGINFSTDFSKSILYSVAAPGTSQHLSMLALDVTQHENPKVREVLAQNGWFQTVVSDLPHFTYLGVEENQLVSLGLRKTTNGGRVFWTP
jgi:hypothetical protein